MLGLETFQPLPLNDASALDFKLLKVGEPCGADFLITCLIGRILSADKRVSDADDLRRIRCGNHHRQRHHRHVNRSSVKLSATREM